MTRSSRFSLCLLVCISVSAAVSSALAELTADHVAILANRNSPDSLTVARHYAERRGIPPERILQLDLPTHETMSRKAYEERLLAPVRAMLEAKGLAPTIRVLITTYGMPLRIDAPQPNESERRWIKDAAERQRFARGYLAQIPEWAGRVAPAHPSEDPSSPPSKPEPLEGDGVLFERVNRAISTAVGRLKQAESREARGTIEQWNQQLARIMVQAGGTAALVRNIESADPQTRANVLKLREQVLSAQTAIRALTDVPSDTNRKQAYQLTDRVFGLEGILRLATAETDTYNYKDGDASLDSELTLLWWDRDHYPVAGRFPNPFFYGNASIGDPSSSRLPLIVVSRLDAPTPQLAMDLVERAMDTEQRGLTGNAYIDSRGIQPDGTVG
ncbi:MAG TPA: TIGR03790 family protein, partial [Nitrospiraceae bacterium]|nr:TIGR03790 family protein [Nitrospiraceae bacterium]